jgi:hypothetical protein
MPSRRILTVPGPTDRRHNLFGHSQAYIFALPATGGSHISQEEFASEIVSFYDHSYELLFRLQQPGKRFSSSHVLIFVNTLPLEASLSINITARPIVAFVEP